MKHNPLAWGLGLTLIVFTIMLTWSEGERIKEKQQKEEIILYLHTFRQRMDLIAARLDLMKMMAERERERLYYPPYRKFPTNDELSGNPLKVPLEDEEN